MAWSGLPFFLLPPPPHPTYKTSKAIKTYGWEAYAVHVSLEEFQKLDGVGKEIPLYLLTAENEKDKFSVLNDKWHRQVFDKYSNEINRYIKVKSGHHIHIEKPKEFLETLDDFLTQLDLK